MNKIDSLLDQYAKYIMEDKITNYNNFNFHILEKNINKYRLFLDEYKEYNNNTWIYFKGIYYSCIEGYKEMLLLLKNINESNIYNLLGYYYRYVEYNSNLMKKYYLMAIELNNSNAMYNLGLYYHYKGDYYLMEKYYLMAIELKHFKAMHSLGYFYQFTEIKYDLMKKYYLMAIYNNNTYAMHYLKYHCKYIENNESNYYIYLYYPRILLLIMYMNRLNKINKHKTKDYNNIFLPEEILLYIFNEYIIK